MSPCSVFSVVVLVLWAVGCSVGAVAMQREANRPSLRQDRDTAALFCGLLFLAALPAWGLLLAGGMTWAILHFAGV
jgi:hypothetical protein